MALTVPNLIKEKKFPFIFTFFVLLICATVFLSTNNTKFPYFSLADLQKQSNPSPSPIPNPNPPLNAVVPPPSSNKTVSDNVSGNVNGGFEIPWRLCKGDVAVDFIPCLDNAKAVKELESRRHMEHRERHCPKPSPRCLVPLPKGYKSPISWPKSRDMIWYDNVPHSKLVEYKKDQNWMRKEGEYLVFPGGGTQFKDGVTNYINFIQKIFPPIQWGRRTRVVLDVGCGVASFGGYLLDKGVITMSFAPKDEHEAQIQLALERGIPATLSVIGTQKLTYPDNAFDMIHCARCRVHWDADGGKPLIELNRILRPGGFFVWSATPVYRNDNRDRKVWNSMVALTNSMCWRNVTKTMDSSGIGLVIFQKPVLPSCYEKRQKNDPPLCDQKDTQNVSWYAPLNRCLSRLPVDSQGGAMSWPAAWPDRLNTVPPSLLAGPDAVEIFYEDSRHWSVLVSDVYLNAPALNWSSVRNIMDMNAGYGGFAAALVDLPYWVMNIVPVHTQDTLSGIFDRGLIGMYHDWCESLSTYPRTYDLLHSSFLFKELTQRCDIIEVVAEIDRLVRPGGHLLIQDTMEMIHNITSILNTLHWSTTLYQGQFLIGRKGFWRPS
ncbi:probable methyltransferase PMT23 [Mercurialis annua]|uniref:probable methyltransferase PMT23 n=1 Tax=Mercurialis annua TaxID=3986 RepID=UPI00215F6C3D|nr:probable methyltransferase PMT23 [Mercurialis annua]